MPYFYDHNKIPNHNTTYMCRLHSSEIVMTIKYGCKMASGSLAIHKISINYMYPFVIGITVSCYTYAPKYFVFEKN